MKFLNLYIKDPNILWLVNKYLKAGVMDEGKLVENGEGSAQGNIISPILANIYMHNVLTLWYKFVIAKESKGENFLIVYADDFIAGFQYKWEAEKYYMTRPRQHRHLKRKDSIRFLVLLVFFNFYIYTGCRKGTRSRQPQPRKDLFKSS